MKTFPMMTSSSSLNTVLNTTVTLSFLASTYLKGQQNLSLTGNGAMPRQKLLPPDSHGLIVSVVDHGPLFALFSFFLELEILFEHGGETVPLEHPCLVDNFIFIGW